MLLRVRRQDAFSKRILSFSKGTSPTLTRIAWHTLLLLATGRYLNSLSCTHQIGRRAREREEDAVDSGFLGGDEA